MIVPDMAASSAVMRTSVSRHRPLLLTLLGGNRNTVAPKLREPQARPARWPQEPREGCRSREGHPGADGGAGPGRGLAADLRGLRGELCGDGGRLVRSLRRGDLP